MKFSTTQEWNPSFYGTIKDAKPCIVSQLYLPPPPSNTRRELDELLKKQDKRTTSQIGDILKQQYTSSIKNDFGITKEDVKLCLRWDTIISPYFFYFKQYFDRVRPSFLEKRLVPCIDVPNHPAYPSGHSTQNYFWAFILGDKYPERRSEFIKKAEEISVNREYAGVHYHSDTIAGNSLAIQLYRIFGNRLKF